MGWLRRLLRSGPRTAPVRRAYAWCGHDWCVAPGKPPAGDWRGTLRTVRTRTWAGCCMEPDEEAHYPQILALEIDGALAPLKRAPEDPDTRARMRAEAAAWKPREGTIGAGPPYVRHEDPLLVDAAAAGLRGPVDGIVTVTGCWYPMFQAGTVFGFQVWGLYVEA